MTETESEGRKQSRACKNTEQHIQNAEQISAIKVEARAEQSKYARRAEPERNTSREQSRGRRATIRLCRDGGARTMPW